MRLLVCGGRNYQDGNTVWAILWALHPEVVIHGAAKGADKLAGDWAVEMQVPCDEFHADWTSHGRAAGPIRNARMLAEGKPDLVLAFPGGSGTENMVKQATAAGIPVILGGAH